jgi:hypothetical protein
MCGNARRGEGESPGGRLTTGDRDPTSASRNAAAGKRWALRRTPGEHASKGREAKTLDGPPAGFGPIQTQQATNGPCGRDVLNQGHSLDFWLLGQMGRAHWATFGPVALSAH